MYTPLLLLFSFVGYGIIIIVQYLKFHEVQFWCTCTWPYFNKQDANFSLLCNQLMFESEFWFINGVSRNFANLIMIATGQEVHFIKNLPLIREYYFSSNLNHNSNLCFLPPKIVN